MAAIRTYWRIFLLIQGVALALVILFYAHTGFRDACTRLGELKQAAGLLGTALATVISGGVIPELLKWKSRPAHLPRPSWGELFHQAGYFAFIGVVVDLFYRLQALAFGSEVTPGVVIAKVAVDQLVFSPLVAIPLTVAWFLWREQGYRLGATWRASTWALYRGRGGPIWAIGLSYWPVMLLFVYALPSALQFPLFLCANAAWALILVFMMRRQVEAARSTTPALP